MNGVIQHYHSTHLVPPLTTSTTSQSSLSFSLPPSLPPTPIPLSLSSEENSSIEGVGVEKLLEVGKLDKLKNGPLFWVDSADSHPCMGEWEGGRERGRVSGREKGGREGGRQVFLATESH